MAESAKKIIAKINAFNPNPGCWFKLEDERIKIIKAREINKKIFETIYHAAIETSCNISKERKEAYTDFISSSAINSASSTDFFID